MSILDTMPRDGRAAGHVLVGNSQTTGLAWGTHLPYAKPAGPISVRCFMKGFNTHIVKHDSPIAKGHGMSSYSLYWLPWGNGSVASVNWHTLHSSNLFLTSTFTGCRFVVNQTGVAHVSWGGHVDEYNVRGDLSSRGRDWAEIRAGTGMPDIGRLRRTLSITGAVNGRPNEERLSYDVNQEFCVVIGWRHGARWTFKCIKMKKTEPMKSHWHTIARVDVNNGVPNIL